MQAYVDTRSQSAQNEMINYRINDTLLLREKCTENSHLIAKVSDLENANADLRNQLNEKNKTFEKFAEQKTATNVALRKQLAIKDEQITDLRKLLEERDEISSTKSTPPDQKLPESPEISDLLDRMASLENTITQISREKISLAGELIHKAQLVLENSELKRKVSDLEKLLKDNHDALKNLLESNNWSLRP